MLDREDAVVKFKLEVLERGLEQRDSAVVFGDIWRIDGAYTLECARRCDRVLLIDSLETPEWQRSRIAESRVDFRKGDFSDPIFMSTVKGRFDVGVVFDILLHQPPLLETLSGMLDLVDNRLCVVQPVLAEGDVPGSLVYLPGNTAKDLYPLESAASDHRLFDVQAVNHSHWIWGMTATFITCVMAAEGFEPVFEKVLCDLPNPRWQWWGAVYERVRPRSEGHWRVQQPVPGLYGEGW